MHASRPCVGQVKQASQQSSRMVITLLQYVQHNHYPQAIFECSLPRDKQQAHSKQPGNTYEYKPLQQKATLDLRIAQGIGQTSSCCCRQSPRQPQLLLAEVHPL
jgi:hypothetical protein